LIDKPTTTVNKITVASSTSPVLRGRQKPDEAKRIYEQVQKENPATEAALARAAARE